MREPDRTTIDTGLDEPRLKACFLEQEENVFLHLTYRLPQGRLIQGLPHFSAQTRAFWSRVCAEIRQSARPMHSAPKTFTSYGYNTVQDNERYSVDEP